MGQIQFNTHQSSDIAEEVIIDIPPECAVVFYNDDFTTKDFVVDILKSVFHKSESEAIRLMELVHKTGKAVVGIYTYDIAVSRVNIATSRARKNGYPLKIEVNQE